MCNIMGAKAFHGPVREGKGWFQRAMGTRHKRCLRCGARVARIADVFGRSKDGCMVVAPTGWANVMGLSLSLMFFELTGFASDSKLISPVQSRFVL